MLNFFRRNWIALLSLVVAASVGAAVLYTPAMIAAIAGLSIAGATPLAFLANVTVMAAATLIGSAIVGFGLIMNGIAALFRGPAAGVAPAVPHDDVVIGADEPEDKHDDADADVLVAAAPVVVPEVAPRRQGGARRQQRLFQPAPVVEVAVEDVAATALAPR